MERSADAKLLSIMVRGAYDLQTLRLQSGIRLVANFRAKLFGKGQPQVTEADADADTDENDAEAEKVIDQLKDSYRNLMAGVARNRTLPAEKGFKGDALISSFPELVLVDSYMALERQEERQFMQLESQLNKFPIWTDYLRKGSPCCGGQALQSGIGPALGGVLVSWFDPAKARHVSNFWKYAGLDVAQDGRGRSRRKEHLIERAYTDKDGTVKTRMSITYDPFLKTKLMGVLAASFIRTGSPWREVYDGYKHRLISDPAREKVTLAEWKKRNKRGEDMSEVWAPGRLDWASKRYMVKMFLLEFWMTWRKMEGLPVSEPYGVARLGHRPHGWTGPENRPGL